jgi:hypothetical protein
MTSLEVETVQFRRLSTLNLDAKSSSMLNEIVEAGDEGHEKSQTSHQVSSRTPANWRNALCGSNSHSRIAAQPLAEMLDLLLECRLHEYVENCGVFHGIVAVGDVTSVQNKLTDFILNVIGTERTKSNFIDGHRNDMRSSFNQLVTQCRLMMQLQAVGSSSSSSHRKRVVRCQRYLLGELTCSPISNSLNNKIASDVGYNGSSRISSVSQTLQSAANIWVPSALAAARCFMRHGDINQTPMWRTSGLTVVDIAANVMAALIVYCQVQRFDGLLTAVCHRPQSSLTTATISDLVVLRAVLDNIPSGLVDVAVVNRPMALGNRALCLASRARRPDVVAALLRHGADVTARCEMGMQCDVVEALLVAPCQNADQMRQQLDADSERCLRLALAAANHLPFGRLESLVAAGYQPRCIDWRRVLVEQACRAWAVTSSGGTWPVVAPLLQLARCAIRSTVCGSALAGVDSGSSATMGVARRIDRLPLPTSLKRYLLLSDS